MKLSDIAAFRFHNQHLSTTNFTEPNEVVAWLGAVQSQDYAGAKWAVAQRAKGLTDKSMDQAFADGTILRTHILRPTWHFITPKDIRWMLALTAPRVQAVNAYYYRQAELDKNIFKRSNAAIIKALEGGKQLTRMELASTLKQIKISADGLRLSYLMMCAELDGIICSGAKRGKQFTYALLDERAPHTKKLERDEALAELAKRYFTSHGPATLQDYVWWSGLTITDAKAGIEMARPQLEHEIIDDHVYWFSPSAPKKKAVTPTVYLLPNYDESLASYKDRSATVDAQYLKMWGQGNPIFSHHLVVNNKVSGSWKRTITKNTVSVDVKPFTTLTETEVQAITAASQRYSEFLGLINVKNDHTL